jgi:hypothetical protein
VQLLAAVPAESRNGLLQATSGFGLVPARGVGAGSEEASCVADAFERQKPTLVAERRVRRPISPRG